MRVISLPLANTNASSIRVRPATDYGSVPKYQDVDAEQAWFWTAGWQTAEREADEDLINGRYEEFDSMDDFIATL